MSVNLIRLHKICIKKKREFPNRLAGKLCYKTKFMEGNEKKEKENKFSDALFSGLVLHFIELLVWFFSNLSFGIYRFYRVSNW